MSNFPPGQEVSAYFFFASGQLFFIELLGEYILQIHTEMQERPLVMEHKWIKLISKD